MYRFGHPIRSVYVTRGGRCELSDHGFEAIADILTPEEIPVDPEVEELGFDGVMYSVTELMDYMRCRRMWDFVSPSRQALQQRGAPPIALHVGSAAHHAFAAQAFGQDPLVELAKWFDTEHKRIAIEYAQRVGTPMSTSELRVFDESRDLTLGIVGHYFERYGPEPIKPFTYLTAELSIRVEILPNVFLVGTIDGLGLDPDGEGIWLIEHKTYTQKADLKWLQQDFQMTGYAWLLQQIIRQPIRGVLYDGILKKVPKAPKVLQSGMLSREWSGFEGTTVYEAAIVEQHGTQWRDNPKLVEYYQPFLTRLEIRDRDGQSPFFTRHKIPMSQHWISQWAMNMKALIEEISSNPAITFNLAWTGCWDCWVPDLCGAMNRGEDLEYVISSNYQKGTYRPQYKAMQDVTPESVGGLEELIAFSRARTTAAGGESDATEPVQS